LLFRAALFHFLLLTLLLFLTSLAFGLTLLVLPLLPFTLLFAAALFSLSLSLSPGLLSLLILFLPPLLIFGATFFTALWPRGLRPLFISTSLLVPPAPLGICSGARAKQ